MKIFMSIALSGLVKVTAERMKLYTLDFIVSSWNLAIDETPLRISADRIIELLDPHSILDFFCFDPYLIQENTLPLIKYGQYCYLIVVGRIIRPLPSLLTYSPITEVIQYLTVKVSRRIQMLPKSKA